MDNSIEFELKNLKTEYDKKRLELERSKAIRDTLLKTSEELQTELDKASVNAETLDKALILLKKISEYARESSRKRIETIVTNCLQYIFDSDIRFSIDITESRGRAEAEFYVINEYNGEELITRPQDSRGGGVVDSVALALRIALLQSVQTNDSTPLILDEPAKHVSDEYIIRVGEFLKQIGKMFDRQIIMVTHNRHLSEISDNWIHIDIKNGMSFISHQENR